MRMLIPLVWATHGGFAVPGVRNRHKPKPSLDHTILPMGFLGTTVLVPGLKVRIQLAEIHLFHTFADELFGTDQSCGQDCLIERLEV